MSLERLLQPARVGKANHRVAFELGEQRFAVTLGVAQHGIEQPFCPGLLQLLRAAHGFTNGGMRRNPGVEQLVQADQQQGLDIAVRCLEWLL